MLNNLIKYCNRLYLVDSDDVAANLSKLSVKLKDFFNEKGN